MKSEIIAENRELWSLLTVEKTSSASSCLALELIFKNLADYFGARGQGVQYTAIKFCHTIWVFDKIRPVKSNIPQ